MMKVTKRAEGKFGGESKMIKSEQCLFEKGQLCQGFRCPGSEAEFSKTNPVNHRCLILCFLLLLLLTEK